MEFSLYVTCCFSLAAFNILPLCLIFVSLTGFPGGSDSKASAYNAGDPGSIPGLGRSPGEGNGNLLQYSCLENPMDGGAWQATVRGVAKSQTWLSDFTFTFFCQFDQYVSWRVSPWVSPVWDSLCLLDLIDYFLFHVGEIFNCNLFKNFLIPFLFLFFWDPIIQMLVCLILFQGSLRLSSVLFILFTLFCSSEVISTILSSSTLINSSASNILLLIPSRVFLISVIVCLSIHFLI